MSVGAFIIHADARNFVTPPAIRITGLKKDYGEVLALKGIDLEIPKGSFYGLLGPNGAGKTTLIHSICGLCEPTAGEIKVHGKSNTEDYREVREHIGLSQQELRMDPYWKIKDLLVYQAGYFGIPKAEATKRAEKLLKQLGIPDVADRTPKQISGGQKRRVELAKALMHEPDILILDEPTAGIDVETRRALWNHITELNKNGMTVLLTTHYIEEAQQLCDTVAIINHGKIIEVAKKSELLDKYARKTIIARYTKQPKDIKGMVREENTLSIEMEPGMDESKILRKLQKAGDLEHLETKRQSLEEVFIELTEDKK